ncbi:MAG: FMN-binding protein [bacterium]
MYELGSGVVFRGLKIFLISSWVVIAGFGLLARRHMLPRPEVGLPQLLLAFPSAHSFSDKLKNPPRLDAYGKDKSLLGSVVRSEDLAPEIKGYAGSISLLTGVSHDGTISGVVVLDHNETPSYVRTLPNWVNTFRGRSVRDSLRLGEDVDGMSGATVTSRAIVDGVRISSRAVARKVYGIGVPEERGGKFAVREIVKAAIAGLLFMAAILGVIRRKDQYRWVTLVLGLVLVGFVYNFQLSILNVSAILSLKPSFALSFWILFTLSVLTAPVLGRVYCNWICPFGAVQEITHRILPKMGKPPPAHRGAEVLKLIILWETTLAAILTANLMYADYEPFMTLFARRGTVLLWSFLGVVLFFSLFRYRFWCRYFCALGGFYYLLSRFRLSKRYYRGGVDDSE